MSGQLHVHGQQNAVDVQVMQGDIVQSLSRADRCFGWVCCITPESDEVHVYWQPHGGCAACDSREPLQSLRCVDRALIPGDIVRRCDIAAGEGIDRGGRDRDAMGMVMGTEVLLDLVQVQGPERQIRQGVAASSLLHMVPIRLASWVVHRADGWLGRVQSWDEDLVMRFAARGMEKPCRCRVRAANRKQGIAIAASFYRDFFPGLTVSISALDVRSGDLECEWLDGDATRATVAPGSDEADSGSAPPLRVEAVIEDVQVGAARVEWLTQVPLSRGCSSERPPRSDECKEDQLIFLLGEAECSSRWALGDRLQSNSTLFEVCRVETFVNVRWQDDVLSARVPARDLQLCNPDAFSFFPSELVCQRTLEKLPGSTAQPRCSTPISTSAATSAATSASGVPRSAGGDWEYGPARAAATRDATALVHWDSDERMRGCGTQGSSGWEEPPSRAGFVVRADPASRMVIVRWLDEGGPGPEEEWSAFDLQIDPEFGYRLGDAVIHCRDWEEPPSSSQNATAPSSGEDKPSTPRVGQVIALESGMVRVRWLDGVVSLHAPRDLFRVGDEEEGSVAGSQDGTAEGGLDDDGGGTGGTPAGLDGSRDMSMPATACTLDGKVSAAGVNDHAQVMDSSPAPTGAPLASTPVSSLTADAAAGASGTGGSGEEQAVAAEAPRALPQLSPAQSGSAAEENGGEVSFEDMAWEPLPVDHHFVHSPPHPAGPSCRQFMRRVQREWEILRRGLPRSIWVHIYPDRTDLLRACLIGPEGTPYSDALFFFDVHLPSTYPQVPPQVKFWSFGENLNPNLYENGKVCLSLLGTWTGRDSETWSPERSNLLQVLVSILGLVLNTEPYYNEPGFERERDTPQGDLRSQRYNESVALSSYHLMLSVLHTPPGDFARAVQRHFAERRAAILERARRLQSGDEARCSEGFTRSLAALLPRLAEALPQRPPSPPRSSSSPE